MPPRRNNKSKSNPFILFANNYCDIHRENERLERRKAIKLASTVWKDNMTNEEKNKYFRLHNEIKIMNEIKKGDIKLNSNNFELIKSTFNTQFIIEPLSLMVGPVEKEVLNRETDDDEFDKLFYELINLEMCSDANIKA
jgi:hypothetical protein